VARDARGSRDRAEVRVAGRALCPTRRDEAERGIVMLSFSSCRWHVTQDGTAWSGRLSYALARCSSR
jgi:hypothetical protein